MNKTRTRAIVERLAITLNQKVQEVVRDESARFNLQRDAEMKKKRAKYDKDMAALAKSPVAKLYTVEVGNYGYHPLNTKRTAWHDEQIKKINEAFEHSDVEPVFAEAFDPLSNGHIRVPTKNKDQIEQVLHDLAALELNLLLADDVMAQTYAQAIQGAIGKIK